MEWMNFTHDQVLSMKLKWTPSNTPQNLEKHKLKTTYSRKKILEIKTQKGKLQECIMNTNLRIDAVNEQGFIYTREEILINIVHFGVT